MPLTCLFMSALVLFDSNDSDHDMLQRSLLSFHLSPFEKTDSSSLWSFLTNLVVFIFPFWSSSLKKLARRGFSNQAKEKRGANSDKRFLNKLFLVISAKLGHHLLECTGVSSGISQFLFGGQVGAKMGV